MTQKPDSDCARPAAGQALVVSRFNKIVLQCHVHLTNKIPGLPQVFRVNTKKSAYQIKDKFCTVHCRRTQSMLRTFS